MSANDHSAIDNEADVASRRFIRIVLAILLAGIAASVGIAIFVDPLHTFGTGRVPSVLTNEREEKPDAFLRLDPPPRAIVLGSSRVFKVRPACITELTGLPAFNFGFTFAKLDDYVAILRFVRAEGRAPLQRLIIGVDIETFDAEEADQRLLSSRRLRQYLGGIGGVSWTTATRALFGYEAFRHGLASLWHHVRGTRLPPRDVTAPDGFMTYVQWEREIAAGTFDPQPAIARVARKLELRSASRRFEALSPTRVATFMDVVRSAHAAGITVDVFVPPVHPAIAAARDRGPIGQRVHDLERMLTDLAREGAIHYVSMDRLVQDGEKLDGWFDGNHMTETMTTRVLLKLFGRDHGCGL